MNIIKHFSFLNTSVLSKNHSNHAPHVKATQISHDYIASHLQFSQNLTQTYDQKQIMYVSNEQVYPNYLLYILNKLNEYTPDDKKPQSPHYDLLPLYKPLSLLFFLYFNKKNEI
jgi:hypothetical protein